MMTMKDVRDYCREVREKAERERCPAVSPQGVRCALVEGHDGEHTALVEDGAVWGGEGAQ